MGVDHAERLAHLRALYEKGHEQGCEFSECIKQCERSLVEHLGMPPFWLIKTYCLLVGSCQHDWHEAEKWRQLGETVYWTLPQTDSPTMKDLRNDLDDLYDYQAEDPDAPSYFKIKEKFECMGRERRYRERMNESALVRNYILAGGKFDGEEESDMEEEFDMEEESDMEEEFDMEEESDMEEEFDMMEKQFDMMEEEFDMEDPIPQFNGVGDDEAAVPGEVGDTGENKDDETEMDEDGRMKADKDGAAVESVQDAAAVQDEVDMQIQPVGSAGLVSDGSATKKPSLVDRAREMGRQMIKRIQSTMRLKGKANEVKKTGSSMCPTLRLAKNDK